MDQNIAAALHNKECPHGHRCRALDCMECMEIYEKVDGLASISFDNINADPRVHEKMGG